MINLIITLSQLVLFLILFVLAFGLTSVIINLVIIDPIKKYKANKLFAQLSDDIMNIIDEQIKRDLEKEKEETKNTNKTTKKNKKTKDEK